MYRSNWLRSPLRRAASLRKTSTVPHRLAALVTAGVVSLMMGPTALAEVTIYTAKLVRTMEPALPEATAVAVENDRILAVGSLESLTPLMEARGGRIDAQFENDIILPGFIDPHVHPSLPAVLTQFPFLAPDDWVLPTGNYPGARTPDDYRRRLIELAAQHTDTTVPFIAWGYHPLWHGDVYREELNQWFGDQPVMIWHRSFHELIGNDAAWDMLGLTEAEATGLHEADWQRGHLWEGGLKAVVPKLGFLFEPARFGKGMMNFLSLMHQGGVTTALDMGTGIFGDPEREIAAIRAVAEQSEVPNRIILTPLILDFMSRQVPPSAAVSDVTRWQSESTERVLVGNHFKLMLDGAIFSGLSQMGPPGYLDGHEGVWMAPRDVTHDYAKAFWNAGFQLHAHANGDEAASWFIDLLTQLLEESPRPDHRMTLEHFAYSTEDQTRQLKALNALVSANPYYHYILSDLYKTSWLGPDRAAQMVRLGSLERAGIPIGLHSDSPMAPLSPLTLMWAACARETIDGGEGATAERLSRAAALRGVTTDAAWILGHENDIGSIRAGKRAEFTVLAKDPLTAPLDELRDIQVVATIWGDRAYPVTQLTEE